METIVTNHLLMRVALALMGVVGMAMCTSAIGKVAAAGRWGDPLSIASYALGVLALTVLVAGLFSWKLPFITTEWQAMLAHDSRYVTKERRVGLRAAREPIELIPVDA